jgi:hypothetical protein
VELAAGLARVERRKRARGAQLLVRVAAAVEVRLRQRIRLLRPGRALRVHEHHVHHVVRLVPAVHARDPQAQAHDEERVEGDGGDDRHLHRRDEAEAFEQEIGEGDEGVGGGLPELHRSR